MKFIYAFIVLCLTTIQSFAQISPDLKTGFGYAYVFDDDESTSPNYHTITGYPTFSVEKPFPIEIRLKKRMSINPGLAWHFFKEEKFLKEIRQNKPDYIKGFNLNHQTVNGYVKVLYQAKFRGKTEAFIYGGGIGGIHLMTKTKGTKYEIGRAHV